MADFRLPMSAAAAAVLLLSACDTPPAAPAAPAPPAAPAAPAAPASPAPPTPPVAPAEDPNGPLTPPAPGQPGALPDDRTPLNETPAGPKSPQAAATLVETYFGLISQQRYAEARKAWGANGEGSGMTEQAFAAQFAPYQSYHALVGKPGDPEGGAGSIYVQVQVQAYGRLKTGPQFNQLGMVTLRRVNDVPGATPDQLKWHISQVDLQTAP
ncbi:hypothetical protein [Phenylobacterium aquaticum]|uniref:hypothetical protein n=1 Tax=Phenylobacterium aquaticum TaxID=1763816 RepID=UPI0026F1DB8A|nr:hypothetical protein [Phenylobacterium aquaticum]